MGPVRRAVPTTSIAIAFHLVMVVMLLTARPSKRDADVEPIVKGDDVVEVGATERGPSAPAPEDDIVPDQQSRWLPGMDLVAEVGFHFADSAGLFAGAGIEGIYGKTEIYTHGEQVAVVPALRAVAEIGFRAGF